MTTETTDQHKRVQNIDISHRLGVHHIYANVYTAYPEQQRRNQRSYGVVVITRNSDDGETIIENSEDTTEPHQRQSSTTTAHSYDVD